MAELLGAASHHVDEVPNLLLHILRPHDGLPDFLSQNLLVPGAQTVHGRFDGRFGHFKLFAQLSVGLFASLAGDEVFELLVKVGFSFGDILSPQSCERLLD